MTLAVTGFGVVEGKIESMILLPLIMPVVAITKRLPRDDNQYVAHTATDTRQMHTLSAFAHPPDRRNLCKRTAPKEEDDSRRRTLLWKPCSQSS